jgi:exoribonuclease R
MYMLDFSGALFDNFMINVNTFGFDICLNSFGLCRIKGKA